MKNHHPIVVVFALLLTASQVAARCSGAQAPAAASSEAVAGVLQQFVDNGTVAGIVTLVASGDKILDLEAVGYADLAAKKPMRGDCLFWIASMTKPITATALMMLVDEGKVNIDDPVEKYLPEFRGQMFIAEQDKDHVLLKKPRRPISIKNVLSHTSGLLYKSPIQQPTLDQFPLGVRVRSYAMLPLQFEPGSKFLYSSAGINTAGRIIEVVSGMPYEEFLARRILAPLGMKDTTFRPSAEQIRRLAKSYKRKADKMGLEETPINQLKYPLDDRQRQPIPGSGLFSTASDISLFCRMILGGGVFRGKRYLSEKSLHQMTTTQTGDLLGKGAGKGGYGLGWFTVKTAPGEGRQPIVGKCNHGGSYKTAMWIDPERQRIMVFMTQLEDPNGQTTEKLFNTFKKAAGEAFGGE
jgi:CubicO group peptidase (beta-lactamase class C family)